MLARRLNKKIIVPLFLLVIGILFLHTNISLNIGSVSINPINATTSQNLNCTWTITGYTSYNVSWYNGSTLFNSTNESDFSWVLPNIHTAKNDYWNCTVIAFNESESPNITKSSYKIQIKNTAPTTPHIENSSSIDIGSYEEIIEGIEYTFNIISSDPDTIDSLSYTTTKLSGNDYCNIADNSINEIVCNATSEPTTATNDVYQMLVSDGENLAGLFMNFNVTPVNDYPSFSTTFNNISMYEDQTLNYNITVADEENTSGFIVTVNSTYNPEKLENYTVDDDDFRIRFTNGRKANFSDIGNYTVTVSLCDPDNSSLCVSDYFNLEVITINHNPSFIDLPNSSGTQNQLFTYYINATDIDITDNLNFTISGTNCGINIWNLTVLENSYNNASAMINVTLTNDHIKCENVTINVTDTKIITSQNVYFDLTNINDAPIIYNISNNVTNSNSNYDIYNLTAYPDVLFYYQINGTDPDLGIDPDETLIYSDNSSLCSGNCPTLTLNSSTGLLQFLPNTSSIGTYYYKITLTDNEGLNVNQTLNITVKSNSAPYFDEYLTNQTINEDDLFEYKINGTDPETLFDSYKDNTTLFQIDKSTGLINFTNNCSDVGNHSITITINDTYGAENNSIFNLEILPVNDVPVLPGVTNVTILENQEYTLDLSSDTTDEDITTCNQGDSLSFSVNFLQGSTLFSITSGGVITFTPNLNSQGNYLANISVTDTGGLYDSVLWNVTIINQSESPVMNSIVPHGNPINYSWAEKSNYPTNITNINATENNNITFDHNTTDSDSIDLYYNWTLDGTVVSDQKNYTKYFDYSSDNSYNITLVVSDNVSGIFAHFVTFTWNLTISDLNRAPLLNNSLPNVSNITTDTIWSNYMVGGIGNIRYNDPDSDTLTYNYSSISIVNISFDGDDVTFSPLEIGQEDVIFSATDGINITYSNNVTINVTSTPNETTDSTTIIILNSGTSGSSTRTTVVTTTITEEVEVEKEVYLDIINPEPVVIYNNNTLRQTISLINNGNKTLKGITVSALTNSSTAKIYFSNNFIPTLSIGETVKTDLIINDYKLFNNYEVILYANVTDPYYKDKAVIYINALVKSKGNQSVTSTKITFAHDLLNSNPECIELNEYLKKALNSYEKEDYEQAALITDSVIQGCKYLVSQSKLHDDRPESLFVRFNDVPYLLPTLIIFFIMIGLITMLTLRAKKSNDEIENK
jgi:hypothetical protein